MCKILKISRSLIYYTSKNKTEGKSIENMIIKIFKESRNNYGTRKIKVELKKKGEIVSRRKIGKIMRDNGLVSSYTIKQFKVHRIKCNEDNDINIVNREFHNKEKLEVIVSDLTYVNVAGKWNYICFILDIHNREIVGYSAGKNKDAKLVIKAFSTINTNLNNVSIFHTDRGSEFKNKVIDELLNTFNIKRSLSKKGCPYDNSVAEATFKILKTEFAFNKIFDSLQQLQYLLFDYVHWFNNFRIHSSLNYLSPIDFKNSLSL
jgi:putative transposase